MRVLVTGGAGFIGSHVVDALIAGGHEVVVIDVLLPAAHDGKPEYLNDDAEYVWADVTDDSAIDEALDKVDAVSHQAAMVGLGVDFDDVNEYVRNNDLATGCLLRALHRRDFRGRLVVGSSMVVYGDGRYRCAIHGIVIPLPRRAAALDRRDYEPYCPVCRAPLTSEPTPEHAPTDPRSVYAATKLHQEHLCCAYGREHPGATVTRLRYHNVYGPRMPADTPYAGVASIFRSSLERGRVAQVFEDGGQRRDFVHVTDIAQANVVALTSSQAIDGALNIGSGSPHTILEFAEAMCRAFPGAPSPKVTGQYRLGDVRHIFASTDRAREQLGFRPLVEFADGVAAFATAALRDQNR